MIPIGISKTENFPPQVALQESFALQNFVPGYGTGKSIELRMRVAMCTALYAAHTNFGQFLPSEHEMPSFPLALQPTTCPINKCSRNIKRRCKIVPLKYWKGILEKISKAVIKG